MITALSVQGADLDAPTMDGRTPVHFAAQHGHVAVLECLYASGADLAAKDKEELTAADFAALHGHVVVFEYLHGL